MGGVSLGVFVMRIHRAALFAVVLFLAAAVAVLIVAWSHSPTSIPTTTFTILGYTNVSHSFLPEMPPEKCLCAETGRDSVSLGLSPWDRTPYPTIRALTPNGWTNYHLGYMTGAFVLVRPSSNYVFKIWLPTNTVRWDIAFGLHTAGLRQRVFWKMGETGLWNRLFPVSQWLIRFVPLREGREVQFKSEEFELDRRPQSNPAAGNAGIMPQVKVEHHYPGVPGPGHSP